VKCLAYVSSVVEQDVQSAKCLLDGREHGLYGGLVANVALQSQPLGAELSDLGRNGVDRSLAPPGNDDCGGTLSSHQQSRSLADSRTTTGDKHHLYHASSTSDQHSVRE
jgi:hypothetical protein